MREQLIWASKQLILDMTHELPGFAVLLCEGSKFDVILGTF